MKRHDKGFRYAYSEDKAKVFQKLSFEERLDWLEQMARFIYTLMPSKSREFKEKLSRGEI